MKKILAQLNLANVRGGTLPAEIMGGIAEQLKLKIGEGGVLAHDVRTSKDGNKTLFLLLTEEAAGNLTVDQRVVFSAGRARVASMVEGDALPAAEAPKAEAKKERRGERRDGKRHERKPEGKPSPVIVRPSAAVPQKQPKKRERQYSPETITFVKDTYAGFFEELNEHSMNVAGRLIEHSDAAVTMAITSIRGTLLGDVARARASNNKVQLRESQDMLENFNKELERLKGGTAAEGDAEASAEAESPAPAALTTLGEVAATHQAPTGGAVEAAPAQ